MIEARRAQTTFADGLIAEEVSDLWEPWMRHSDAILEDVERVEIVCQALSKRCRKSKTRGRKGTPADVVLRLLALKHMFNWSYDELHREVRANLVYREFTRTGGGKVPDDKIPWDGWRGKPVVRLCQGKVEMSPSRQNRNVPFSLDLGGVHVNLRVPVKRRRAMLASNPIKE